MAIFVIEDEQHAERCGEFLSFEKALEELKSRAKIPWDMDPNICPCTNWKSCGRNYEIIEFDNAQKPWAEICRTPVLEISSRGIFWEKE